MNTTSEEVIIKIRADVINAKNRINSVRKDLKKLSAEERKSAGAALELARAEQEVYNKTKKLNNALGNMQFQGWAMSALFFGMAIQRAFLSIAKFGLSTFREITSTIEGTTNASVMLEGSMKYLGYTIGEALQPIVEVIIPIVDSITEWVSENEKLSASLVKWGIIIGTVLFLIGTLVLGIGGTIQLIKYLGVAINFLVTNPIALLITGFVAVGLWISYLTKAMGGIEQVFLNALRGVVRIILILVSAILGVGAEVWNGLKYIWNSLVTFIEKAINKVISGVNLLIKLLNKIPGFNIPLIGKVDFSAAKAEVLSFGTAMARTYEDVMSWYMDLESKYLAPANGYMTPGKGLSLDKMPPTQVNNVTVNQNISGIDGVIDEQRLAEASANKYVEVLKAYKGV